MSFDLQRHREVSQVTSWQDPTLGIMRWGAGDVFPQTFTNFVAQSANAYPTITRAAQFFRGQGFKGEEIVVSPTGLTLKDIVHIMAEDYAYFKAFSLQTNYNVEAKVSSINPMRIAALRFNEFDELNYASKIGYHPNFGLNAVERKLIQKQANKGNIKWFDRFNSNEEIIQKQIENSAGGKVGNYNGQILYYSGAGHSSYPIPPLQAPINYVLSDIENSILVRKETATGFVNSYILKTSLSAEDETLQRLEESIYNSQGARGSGKVITFSDLTPEEINSTVLEEIGSGGSGSKNTMESAILTYELDQKVITGAYLIPPILAGFGISNGLSGQDLKEAYNVYNAITQEGRDIIEQHLNKVLQASVFKDLVPKIKIQPLSLEREMVGEIEGGEGEIQNKVDRNPLTGRQEQSLQRIVRNYNKGKLTKAQAEDQMRNDLGFTDERILTWLEN